MTNTNRKSNKKKAATRWYDGTTPFEELGPNEQIAHQLATEFRDLTPSIERIMTADLGDDERYDALTAFRSSLSRPSDPNRDPRVAIANAIRTSLSR